MPTGPGSRLARASWLLLLGLALLFMGGCAGLPAGVEHKPSVAITDGADTILVRLVSAASPPFRRRPIPCAAR